MRASIQLYVPWGEKKHFLGEVARAGILPKMLGKYFLRIGDQTQDNVRMVSTDGELLGYDEIRSGEVHAQYTVATTSKTYWKTSRKN